MHGSITFNHNFFLGDLSGGYVSYAHAINNSGYTVHGGVHYVSYGDFDQTNVLGDVTGTFKAGEQAICSRCIKGVK